MQSFSWRLMGKDVKFDRPLIVGILNLTPDSFYAKSRCESPEATLKRAKKFISEGASILDLGAESTRPGAEFVSEEEEIERLVKPLKILREALPDVPISVDTRRALVAMEALKAGADIINDVSSLSDPLMPEVAARYGCGLILTHAPENLASGENKDVSIDEIKKILRERTSYAVGYGVLREAIVWDPGLGFGKTVNANWQIIQNLTELSKESIVMCAASRKRFTRPNPELPESPENSGLMGTIKANLLAVENGAALLRVHDVAENFNALRERKYA